MADLADVAREIISILDDPVILAIAERIREGELGCRECGETFPRNGRLVCARCGADLRVSGYLDGRDVAATQNSVQRPRGRGFSSAGG